MGDMPKCSSAVLHGTMLIMPSIAFTFVDALAHCTVISSLSVTVTPHFVLYMIFLTGQIEIDCQNIC